MQLNEDFITRKELKEEIQKLTRMIYDLKQTNEQKKYLTGPEMQKFLGCSSSTLRRLRIKGSLKPIKLGGTYYYNINEITN
jgi:Fic family protein